MQTENEDRRATHVRRVELETLVEICGRDPEVPPFEARSVEISGRGMQVRTRYLPELRTPLVMRFEQAGHEVLVEGEVAWREGDEHGGQFGIKFTALDSKSVTALKALCSSVPVALQAESDDSLDEPAYLSERGAPVKLHIQGLAAPMKARVVRGSARKLEVGSQLEFLKLGRTLELEDISDGTRRNAQIATVNVAIDAENQIPQLVVSLRYDGTGDETPEPTVLTSKKQRDKVRAARVDSADSEGDASDDEDFADDEPDEYTEDIFKGKVGALLSQAGVAMKNGSVQVAEWSARAVGGVGHLVRATTERVGTAQRTRSTSTRKTTRASVAPGVRQQGRRPDGPLRRQGTRGAAVEAPPRRGRTWVFAGAVALSAVGAALWWGTPSASDGVNTAGLAANATALPPGALPGAPVNPALANAAGAQAAAQAAAGQAAARGVQALPEPVGPSQGVPVGQFPKPAALNAAEQRAAERGIMAQVPLFGATPMATLEPTPVNPVPLGNAVDEYSLAKDQVFSDDVVPRTAALPRGAAATPALQSVAPSEASEAALPEGQAVFQVGRMHLPVVYRLRLDGAGTALQGSKLPTGFSVLLPGRKVMENGSSIEGRDDRIMDVRVQNTPAGGKVTFRFRKDIPGYKARLRKDYVEFFVNSPQK